jgi:hypothetical protein
VNADEISYPVSSTAELIGSATASLRRISHRQHYAKCSVILAELCPAGARQVDSFDTWDIDRRRLMTPLGEINLRMGRDSVFYAGAGIHRDWQSFATPAMSILPDLRHIRSESLTNTHAQPGLAERIRFAWATVWNGA